MLTDGVPEIVTAGVEAKAGSVPDMPKLVFAIVGVPEIVAVTLSEPEASDQVRPVVQVPLCVTPPTVFAPVPSTGLPEMLTEGVPDKLTLGVPEMLTAGVPEIVAVTLSDPLESDHVRPVDHVPLCVTPPIVFDPAERDGREDTATACPDQVTAHGPADWVTAPMTFDPADSAGSDASDTGCVACQKAPVTETVGAEPMLTVGGDAKLGRLTPLPKLIGTGLLEDTCEPATVSETGQALAAKAGAPCATVPPAPPPPPPPAPVGKPEPPDRTTVEAPHCRRPRTRSPSLP